MKKLLFVAVMSMSTFIYAKEYTPEMAITTAFENNYEINRSNKDVEIKEIDYKKSIKLLFPKVTFASSFVKLNEDISLLGRTIADSDFTYTNKITIKEPLFTGGAISNGIKFLNISKDMEVNKLDQKKREIRLTVLQNYMGILKLTKNKDIMENLLKEMNDSYKLLNDKLDLGLIQKKPVLDLKYRILEIKSNIVSINSEIDVRKMTLKSLMGISPTEDIDIKLIEIPTVDIESINLAEDIKYAISNKKTIKNIEINRQLSEINKNVKKSELLPKVYLKFNYETYGKEYGSSTSGTWNVAITTDLNVFDFGANLDEISKAKKDIEQKELDKEIATDKIEIAVKTNYFELERLRDLTDIKAEALESSKENYRIEKQKFDLDMEIATDLLSAENDFRKAETDLINTKIDLYTSYLKYLDTIEKEAI